MRVEVEPSLRARLSQALRQAGRREIGGMLFAEQIAPSHFRLIEASFDVFSGSHIQFRRDPSTHRRAIDDFFKRTQFNYERFNYLGEWHSHPSFSVLPSKEDIATMHDIIADQSSAISFAVLLIVRLRFFIWLDASLTLFNRGYPPMQIEVVR
jgi:proteasome lid subunit RPN8/RPN11